MNANRKTGYRVTLHILVGSVEIEVIAVRARRVNNCKAI